MKERYKELKLNKAKRVEQRARLVENLPSFPCDDETERKIYHFGRYEKMVRMTNG